MHDNANEPLPPQEPQPPFTEYYNVTRRGNCWEYRCKKCSVGYSVLPTKQGDIAIGNRLALLNHAHSHT